MNRKQKIIISITGIIVVTLILLGLTYGYFITRIVGNTNSKSISGKISNLSLSYGEDTSDILVEINIKPGDEAISKTFTATNTGDGIVDYVAVLENITNELTRQEDLVYTLECKSYKKGTTTISGTCDGVKDIQFPKTGEVSIMVGNRIPVGITHSYTLTVLYKEAGVDQSVDIGKTFGAKVNIRDVKTINPYTDGTLAHTIISNAIKSDNGTELVSTPDTRVAEEVSKSTATGKYHEVGYFSVGGNPNGWYYGTSDMYYYQAKYASSCSNDMIGQYVAESVYCCGSFSGDFLVTGCDGTEPIVKAQIYDYEKKLSVSHDDYGNTYYYRGNVINNYLNYGGKCWRIVRIQGDGSIKIVLEDNTQVCSSSIGNWNIGTANYGYTYDYVKNASGIQSSAKKNVADYINAQTNTSSSMKNKYDVWLNNNSSIDKIKLKNDDWCLGNQIDPYNSTGNLLSSRVNVLMYNSTTFYYDVHKRLYGTGVVRNATMKCNADNYKKSKSYIGALTADEVAYAGGKAGASNKNFYLFNNYLSMWTLSVDNFTGTNDNAYSLNSSGYFGGYSVGSNFNPRPVIVLNNDIMWSSGDGTQTNPYILK